MATIHYSISGEGRGHAARAQVLVDLLKERHKVVVLTYGAAWEMLAPHYAKSEVEVRQIPGMRFAYDAKGTLDRPASLMGAMPFLAKLPGRASRLATTLEQDRCDLAVVDFEPLLPRAAELAGIPTMSVDHQQFLTSYDLSALPADLRKEASLLAPFVAPYYKRLVRAVISSFFFAPLKRKAHPIDQIGVLLRPSILQATPENGEHLVAYVRRDAPKNVLHALNRCGRPVRVYGNGPELSYENLRFCSVDPARFAEDLATSTGLVTTAGNQVVGEALSLGKPVLAYPEPGNLEQKINGYFLEESGQGWSRKAARFNPRLVQKFIERAHALRARIQPERLNGNQVALRAVEQEISAATQGEPCVGGSPASAACPREAEASPLSFGQALSSS